MAPREKKPIKYNDDLKRKRNFFKRIYPGFKKKATELSVLCGNSVGFICYGPDNDLHVWPEPQENPQALPQIVAQFNAMNDQKRKHHACDLDDFPNLKGLSSDELRSHLSKLNSHLVEIRQKKLGLQREKSLKDIASEDQIQSRPKKLSIMRKSKPSLKETLDNNATITNQKACSSEDQSSSKLGFGGVFDELGYVVRGSHETVFNLETCAASKVSEDVGVSDSSLFDPFTLGFSDGDYVPANFIPVTHNLGVCANDGFWDPSWLDSEFSSTLFAHDSTVYGYDPLLRATDSFTASIHQSAVTDNFGSVF